MKTKKDIICNVDYKARFYRFLDLMQETGGGFGMSVIGDVDRIFDNKVKAKSVNNKVSKLSSDKVKFLEKTEYKEFFARIIDTNFQYRGLNGKVSSHPSIEQEIIDYFKLCLELEIIPTVPSLCVYLSCNLNELYKVASNPTLPNYGAVNKAIISIQAVQEQATIEGDMKPNLYQFLSKNYYGLRDTQTLVVGDIVDNSLANTSDTVATLEEQLELESKQDEK